MIEDEDTAIKNIKLNKTFRCNIMSCKNQTPHTHRIGIEPCVQSTSEELRKRNEIQTDEDLYKNIYREDFLYEGQTIYDEELLGTVGIIPHGYGKMTFPQLSNEVYEVSYEGGFKYGKRDGYGLIKVSYGCFYEGLFANGEKHGKGFCNYKTANNFVEDVNDLVEIRHNYSNGEQVGLIEYVFDGGATTVEEVMNKLHRKNDEKSAELCVS